MAYRVPSFNIWVEVKNDLGISRGWTLAQLRGPVNGLFDIEQTSVPTQCVVMWEFLFPAGSDVRTKNCTGTVAPSGWDVICVHGDITFAWDVQSVGDKAAGFSNEYRLVYATRSQSLASLSISTRPMPRVNPGFTPPGGYTPLPVAGLWP